MKLDQIDLKILAVLQDSARITNQKLSEAIGLSPSPCLQRVRRLEQAGVISGYRTEVALEKICRSVTVIVTVTLRTHDEWDFQAFEEAVSRCSEVVECMKVSGSFDYLLRFVCADVERYHKVSDTLLRHAPGVRHMASHVVLDRTKTFKGFPLEELV